jgi:hypothetical protein
MASAGGMKMPAPAGGRSGVSRCENGFPRDAGNSTQDACAPRGTTPWRAQLRRVAACASRWASGSGVSICENGFPRDAGNSTRDACGPWGTTPWRAQLRGILPFRLTWRPRESALGGCGWPVLWLRRHVHQRRGLAFQRDERRLPILC